MLGEARPLYTEELSRDRYVHVEKQVQCAAKVVYDEARGEPLQGKVAVLNVVLNRAKATGKSICDVVYQKANSVCQFSGMCKKKNITVDDEHKQLAYDFVIQREYKDNTKGATHFHAVYVEPSWSRKYERTTKIGNHIFYRSNSNRI